MYAMSGTNPKAEVGAVDFSIDTNDGGPSNAKQYKLEHEDQLVCDGKQVRFTRQAPAAPMSEDLRGCATPLPIPVPYIWNGPDIHQVHNWQGIVLLCYAKEDYLRAECVLPFFKPSIPRGWGVYPGPH
jgi:hypothetical protein